MMVIVAGVMIGLCLAIMEQGARKAHTHTKEQSLAKQPRVKVGDRVRITESRSFYLQPGTCGVVVRTHSASDSFEIKTDTSYGTLAIAELCGDTWEILQPAKEQNMSQQTFKVGYRVRVKTSISSCIKGCGKTGVITDDRYALDWPYRVQFDDGGDDCFKSEHLELFSKTLDNLIEGDVVADKHDTDDTMAVTHVLKPGLYVMSDYDEEPWLYTAKEVENLEYIPQQDPKNDKTRLTVSEVAKKLGLDPDTLHIVADKKAV